MLDKLVRLRRQEQTGDKYGDEYLLIARGGKNEKGAIDNCACGYEGYRVRGFNHYTLSTLLFLSFHFYFEIFRKFSLARFLFREFEGNSTSKVTHWKRWISIGDNIPSILNLFKLYEIIYQ